MEKYIPVVFLVFWLIGAFFGGRDAYRSRSLPGFGIGWFLLGLLGYSVYFK
jgi:hypothetical protein